MADIDIVLERLVNESRFRTELTQDPAAALASYDLSEPDLQLLAGALDDGDDGQRGVEQRTSKSAMVGLLASLTGGEGQGALRATGTYADGTAADVADDPAGKYAAPINVTKTTGTIRTGDVTGTGSSTEPPPVSGIKTSEMAYDAGRGFRPDVPGGYRGGGVTNQNPIGLDSRAASATTGEAGEGGTWQSSPVGPSDRLAPPGSADGEAEDYHNIKLENVQRVDDQSAPTGSEDAAARSTPGEGAARWRDDPYAEDAARSAADVTTQATWASSPVGRTAAIDDDGDFLTVEDE